MPKILYGVSPIGLGHAARGLAVREELVKAGAQVTMFSGGKAAEFIRRQGIDIHDVVSDPVPSVSGGEMRWVTYWYLRSWFALRASERRTGKLVGALSPDLVVGDEEFSGMTCASRAGIRRAFVADELELGFARTPLARKVERRVEGWYRRLQDSVDLLMIPEEGTDAGNRRYVGPITRRVTLTREETRKKYGLPEGPLILYSMSGSGIGGSLLRRVVNTLPELRGDVSLAVTGNRKGRFRGNRVFDLGVIDDNQNVVAASDLVVSTAGKSTIDEAAAAGTPVITIPIRYHAEQERNAASLGYSFEDIDRLPALIEGRLGRRAAPRPNRGAEAAAKALLAISGTSPLRG